MRERIGQILKGVCAVLAAVLLYQLVQVALRVNPLAHVVIPPLPTLASDTNAIAGAPASGPARIATNGIARVGTETNVPGSITATNISGTNVVAVKKKKEKGTNAAPMDLVKAELMNNTNPLTPALSPSVGARENVVQHTNESAVADAGPVLTEKTIGTTNVTSASNAVTNSPTDTNSVGVTISETKSPTNASPMEAVAVLDTNPITTVSTNSDAMTVNTNVENTASNSVSSKMSKPVHAGSEIGAPTNALQIAALEGTNSVSPGTNSAKRAKSKSTNSSAPPAMAMNGMNMGGPPGMRGGGKPAELAPEIKARVDRIYESELFGQVIRPVPMGLLGIAGNMAILRSPSGQTGLVKEGDSLGELKLLRIGINRVLVEQDGKKSELMIFDGYGGESLMPKDKEISK